MSFLYSGSFSSGGCAPAHPLGVVPEIRAGCLQSIWIFYTLCFISCLPSIGRLFFRWVRASPPTGCSPRDSGRLLATESDLLLTVVTLNSLLLFLAGCYGRKARGLRKAPR